MGVPRLFKYIRENYSNCIKYYDSGKHIKVVDNLFFDANALIYTALYDFESISMVNIKYRNMNEAQREKEIFKLFMEKLKMYVKMFTPQKLIFIAIDGCAPIGKQAQQRQRRFVSSKERDEESFDKCQITPGTKFMLHLTRFMNYSIREAIAKNEWRCEKVYFSPPSIVGEGEHKVMEYIRNNYKEISKQKNVLYGPDGDLIMLSLATYCSKYFSLIREKHGQVNTIVEIYCSRIMNYFVKDMRKSFQNINAKCVLNDFNLMGFFVGNDFLPKIQMFHFLEKGLDTMIGLYKNLISETKSSMTYICKFNEFDIDIEIFSKFVESIEIEEEKCLQEQLNTPVDDIKFINKTLEDSAVITFEGGKTIKRLNFKRYRVNYYRRKFGIDHDKLSEKQFNDKIIEVCKKYMDGLYWVFWYYLVKCVSFKWYYPYHYAPLFSDFKKYLKSNVYKPPNFNKKDMEKPEPFQQLLTVLPPNSMYLLPEEYSIIINKNSIKHLYPEKFDIDYEGKLATYQGIARLPFVSFNVIKEEYKKVKPKLSYQRNKSGYDMLFTNNNPNKIKYSSDYGTIVCQVKTVKIEKK